VHGKRGKIIGRRELWGANRRPVNQPPIIIDTSSTSLPFLSQRIHPSCRRSHRRSPHPSRKPALCNPRRNRRARARARGLAAPALPPSTCRRSLGIPPPGVTNAPPIPSFISQMRCKTAAIHFRSSRFSFPLRGSALMAARARARLCAAVRWFYRSATGTTARTTIMRFLAADF